MVIFLPTSDSLKDALRILHQGELIGLPTETVYGLAADATQDLAIAKIFDLKKRPIINPLIIHGPSLDSFKEHVLWNETAEVLARAFWPGPLTLVLPRLSRSSTSLLASAGLDTLAIRVPNHPIALSLLSAFGKLVAAPSANPSGKISPTQSNHVEADFPHLFILEGGDTSIGLESTIIDLTTPAPTLLRPGGINQEAVESLIGPLDRPLQNSIKAPGMMKSHYAPLLPLRLNAYSPLEEEAFLAFGPTSYKGEHVLNLSEKADLKAAAANLFTMMRQLDHPSFCRIAVAPIPFNGLGLALNDRLQRAAAPREL
ncbi:MAG: threonylcarbamoyl-AMP synthase [Alphaproteobacteria bacterium]|nr:threonylcarbamoyl-AMP synthase [Alphaproteobacteria bacterium]